MFTIARERTPFQGNISNSSGDNNNNDHNNNDNDNNNDNTFICRCLSRPTRSPYKTPGASCTKLAYAQKSCVRHFSRKRSDVQRLT